MELYDVNLASLMLGSLMKRPQLLSLPEYPLDKATFAPSNFHQVIFVCIAKLARSGVGEVTEVEIESVLQNHAPQMEVCRDNNYLDFIYTVKELANPDNYEYYYSVIRKFALLRELDEQGVDIKEFYDTLGNESDERAKLEKLTIEQILNAVEYKANSLRTKYDSKYVREEMTVGEDIEGLLAEFDEKPSYGAFLFSPYQTELAHGFNRGHLFMRSMGSGSGKTRMAVADICGLCVDQMWDDEAQDFIPNPNYQGAGFFIHTELAQRTEMQPMFLACVANVPSNTITMGKCTDEERKRVIKAAEIIKNCDLRLIDMPDFTSANIDRKIKECVEGYGATYGCFDYMMLNSTLSMEYRANTGVQAREDMALRGLATDLKAYAEKYNVGLLTMTQTNGNEKQLDFPDESCISSSKASRTKVDFGCVILPAKDRNKEMKLVEPFIKHQKEKGLNSTLVPNRITYIYKSRFGEYQDRKLKIFHYFDMGTMRNTDFFVCDSYNKFVSIPKPKLK